MIAGFFEGQRTMGPGKEKKIRGWKGCNQMRRLEERKQLVKFSENWQQKLNI
jgi:hypothetical protein